MRLSLTLTTLPPLGLLCLLLWLVSPASALGQSRPDGSTIPPIAPVLMNGDFECTTGYYSQTNSAGKTIYAPNGWRLVISQGAPKTHSARINFARSCDGSAHVERIQGIDSILLEAQDLEKPPEPGKPFDVTFYQQVSATVGGAYSLSGWLLSLCGGSATPSDCPAGYYMAKMLGIDPTGGIDPLAATVVWAEDRRNFLENNKRVGWTNVRLAATAQSTTITVFARVASPFQWHGNHAFIDALGFVRSPAASLAVPREITGTQVVIVWDGEQTPDVTHIPGGNYKLYFDLQYRHQDASEWIEWVSDYEGIGSKVFSARCMNNEYQFRVRARAEQPDGTGAQPNQRYSGVWSEPTPIFFHGLPSAPPAPLSDHLVYLPLVANLIQC